MGFMAAWTGTTRGRSRRSGTATPRRSPASAQPPRLKRPSPLPPPLESTIVTPLPPASLRHAGNFVMNTGMIQSHLLNNNERPFLTMVRLISLHGSKESAVAAYLSRYLPYELSTGDIVLTVGCNHAIEIMMAVLAMPGANVLLPRPGYPMYQARAALGGLEFRHYNFLPDKGWEVDIEGVEAIADENTVAIVMVNPNNPCGSVYSYEHLTKIAETARKLGIMVISDEVYEHCTFGSKPFVPMGVFGEIAPVVTLGSISKRWMVPGWRLGWIAMTDPKGILRKKKILESIVMYRGISVDPSAIIQGAIPQILANTDDAFFRNAMNTMREAAEICYQKLKCMECITCPHKPEGSMFVMVELDISYFDGIDDDIDFCTKLAKEESVVICPGSGLGMKNWLRVSFAVDPLLLEDGLERLKSFCLRHAKPTRNHVTA